MSTSPEVTSGAAPPNPPDEPIRGRVVRASMWSIGAYGASQIIRFGSNLVLTRLLFPEAFGLNALVLTFLLGLQMFADIGTGPAIIQSAHGDDERFLNTAWTLQCIRGTALFLGYCAIAKPLSLFYGQPMLSVLLPVAGIGAVLDGFGATSVQVAQRHLRPQWQALIELSTQLANIVTIMTLATVFRSYFREHHLMSVWSIVAGGLASELTRLFLSHKVLPGIRHRFMLDPEARKLLGKTGRWVFLSTALMFLASQADRLMLGKKIPLELLGVYGIALALGNLPTQGVQRLAGSVLFPAYSRIVHRPDFKKAYLKVRYPLLLGGAAAVSGFIACGPPLIRLLYDKRYQDAGWILQFLAVASWFQILEAINNPALLAFGRFGWLVVNNVTKLASFVAFVPLGFHLGGLRGALLGLALSDVMKYFASQIGIAARGLHSVGRDALTSLVVACVAALAIWIGAALGARTGNNLVRLLASGFVVVAIWGTAGLVYWRRARDPSGQAVPA